MGVPPSDSLPPTSGAGESPDRQLAPGPAGGGLVGRLRARAERAPRSVVAVAALTTLEAVALLAYTVAYTFEVLPLGDNAGTRALIAGGVVVFLLIAAAGLVLAAWSLLGLNRWPLSLIVVAQLVTIPVLWPLARGGMPALWVALAGAVVIVVLALTPTTTAAVNR